MASLVGRKCKRDQVLFLSSRLLKVREEPALDYFTALTTELVFVLQLQLDLVVLVPYLVDARNNQPDQLQLLHMALANHECYSAIIIAPLDTASLKGKLIEWMAKNRDYPILTIDKSFSGYDRDFNLVDELLPPPSVVVKGETGGRLAAMRLKTYTDQAQEKHPCFLVLRGQEGSKERVEGFRTYMRDVGVEPEVSDELQFTQKAASTYLLEEIFKKGRSPHGIFCCNDEMALGARDACEKQHAADPTFFQSHPKPRIIGFDGIGQVRTLIDTGDEWLLGTIDVRLDVQVSRFCELLRSVIRKRSLMSSLRGESRYQEEAPILVSQ